MAQSVKRPILDFGSGHDLRVVRTWAWSLLKILSGDTWVVQLVKRPNLGFHLGHDLRIVKLSPRSGSALRADSA